tara:strand:- start:171346 stop:172317 length:972 start_codon:yes stop_codon:yes gene_type:complete
MHIGIKSLVTLTVLLGASAAHGEVILFAGEQGIVRQLDTQTGEVTFRGTCGGPVNSMIVYNDSLYIGDRSGVVYILDLESDTISNTFAIDSDASAMALQGDELVIADSVGSLDYIDLATNEINRSIVVSGTDITAMGIDGGGLFVGGQSTIAQRSHIDQNNFQFFAACGSMINSMTFGDDTLYLGGIAFGGAHAGTVYLFDKFEGGVNYSGTHGVDSDTTAMVHAETMLYIAGSDGVIHEMDTDSGEIVRTFETGVDIQAMTVAHEAQSCRVDFDASGRLDFHDVSHFIDIFAERLVPADIDGDGEYNFFDVSMFLDFFSSGC